MGVKKTEQSAVLDVLKWTVAIILLAAGFVANFYFSGQPLSLRVVGWIILVGVVLLVAVRTIKGQQAWRFFKDARNEMRKVVWPSRRETFQQTLMVIVIVIVFAVIMWGADSILMWAISWLTGQRG